MRASAAQTVRRTLAHRFSQAQCCPCTNEYAPVGFWVRADCRAARTALQCRQAVARFMADKRGRGHAETLGRSDAVHKVKEQARRATRGAAARLMQRPRARAARDRARRNARGGRAGARAAWHPRTPRAQSRMWPPRWSRPRPAWRCGRGTPRGSAPAAHRPASPCAHCFWPDRG